MSLSNYISFIPHIYFRIYTNKYRAYCLKYFENIYTLSVKRTFYQNIFWQKREKFVFVSNAQRTTSETSKLRLYVFSAIATREWLITCLLQHFRVYEWINENRIRINFANCKILHILLHKLLSNTDCEQKYYFLKSVLLLESNVFYHQFIII